MKILNKQQERAARAIEIVAEKQNIEKDDVYASFALSFPALLHNCGLVQSIAFAFAKTKGQRGKSISGYLEDLAKMMNLDSAEKLGKLSREVRAIEYMRLSAEAMSCAGWLKRYVEAMHE
ncbi:type III-B CRISPR module-associated protein Cmr5 [Candidatus Bathyarchaeota archaeon]|nr:type III-B CRISPR module-associated protein Cmr5 [Candidatus Bathyarchaeota archaeon]